ncbi:hypothetical protein BGZ83_011751 [Gryganskiella cystojenkinii]|nr:hypothetical protein BGZ83_011751 [Gryganskiella cystojenkinii]
MPPSKQTKKAPPRNGNVKAKASPYNKNAKSSGHSTSNNSKKTLGLSKPQVHTGRTKHLNTNLTSELDSLLGDLNSQLTKKKTKRDARSVGTTDGISAAEKALNEAQAKHESLQSDMMSALDGISALGK